MRTSLQSECLPIFFKIVPEQPELGWAYKLRGDKILYGRGMDVGCVLYRHISSLFIAHKLISICEGTM